MSENEETVGGKRRNEENLRTASDDEDRVPGKRRKDIGVRRLTRYEEVIDIMRKREDKLWRSQDDDTEAES